MQSTSKSNSVVIKNVVLKEDQTEFAFLLLLQRLYHGIEDGIVVKSHEIHSETDVGLLTHFLSSFNSFLIYLRFQSSTVSCSFLMNGALAGKNNRMECRTSKGITEEMSGILSEISTVSWFGAR